MRLINADAYMEKVKHEAKAMPQKQGKIFVILSEWIMEKTPSIEPKRGEWIEIKRYWEINQWVYEIECSVCKERIKNPYEPHFCPNCGAKMKGTENNKECHKPESLYYRAFCEERKDSAYCDGCEFWY